MKEIKYILAGIGFNIFGIACMMVLLYTHLYGLLIPGSTFPLIGTLMIIYSLFIKNDKN